MSIANKIVITTQQIIDAHTAHGDDFIQINFESARKFKNYAQYIDVDIKLADGTVTGVRHWKLSSAGIVIGSKLRLPEQRKYESMRLGVTLKDDGEEVNENAHAMKLICTSFENIMTKFKSDNVITDDSRAPRKQSDGTYRPFHLISTKIVTPMQTTAKSKETGDIIDLENPFFWLSLPKKKFFKVGEQPKTSIHYEDKYYADESGQPDVERPIMTHEYAPEFYNVDDFFHHPRTGKKIYNKLGYPNAETDVRDLDNTNIHKFLTRHSALMGNLKFELTVSGRQCKLDIALYGKQYVKVMQEEEGSNVEEDECVDAFSTRYNTISKSKESAIGDDDDMSDDE